MKQQYDSYKDSGVEWIGEIPEHWHIMRLKYIFDNLDYLREPISSSERERKNPQYDYYGASGVIDKIDRYNVEDTVLLIGEDGANLVMRNLPLIYKATGKFWVNNHAHILKPKINYNYSYMAYILESGDYTLYITGSAQPKLSQDNLNQFLICIPPLAEQEAIAAWLDEKCGEIDKVIDGEKHRINLLNELKQSVITEAVTHGLNPNAPLKPSGVDWIGDIPEHWTVRRLKTLSNNIRNGYVGPTRDILVEAGIPYIQSLHIKDGKILFDRGEYYVSKEWGQKHPKIKKEDILIVQTGDIGQIAEVDEEFEGCNCHALIIVQPTVEILSHYMGLYLRSAIGKELMLLTKTGALLPHLNSTEIGYTQIVLAPIAEQQAIVEYLDAKCGAIDADIAKTKRKIELLQEYKQSLITEAVTGKRKVI